MHTAIKNTRCGQDDGASGSLCCVLSPDGEAVLDGSVEPGVIVTVSWNPTAQTISYQVGHQSKVITHTDLNVQNMLPCAVLRHKHASVQLMD